MKPNIEVLQILSVKKDFQHRGQHRPAVFKTPTDQKRKKSSNGKFYTLEKYNKWNTFAAD